jgi:hypothetical protein
MYNTQQDAHNKDMSSIFTILHIGILQSGSLWVHTVYSFTCNPSMYVKVSDLLDVNFEISGSYRISVRLWHLRPSKTL